MSSKSLAYTAIVGCTHFVFVFPTLAEWPQFRGPHGNGVLEVLEHPETWNQDESIAWDSDIAGAGWSSPIVTGDRIYLTSAVAPTDIRPKGFGEGVASMRSFFQSNDPVPEMTFEVHCLSLSSGEVTWSRTLATEAPRFRVHPSNTYATESPVTDGENVYAYFASIGIVAGLDAEGNELWTLDVGAFPTSSNFGTGSSLAMHEGRLFLQCDNQEQSFLLGIDAESGEQLLTIERSGRTCWSSPVVWQNVERTELVVCGSGNVTSYAPESGDVLWQLDGIDGSFSASPAFDHDRIYFGNSGPGSSGPLVAVAAGASGQLTLQEPGQPDSGVAWTQPNSGPGLCSPVAHGGELYVVGRGILSCYDCETGDRIYRTRLDSASNVAASPWIAGDRLFILDESGNTFVIKTGREYELASTNSIDGLFWSTPAASGDALLLRGSERLYCVRSTETAARTN